MMSRTGHLEMEELLAVRDGEGTRFARSHVESCERCRSELDRLHQVRAGLRAFHPYKPPRDLWPQVAKKVVRRRMRTRIVFGVGGLAAAAALAGVLLLREAPLAERPPVVAEVWVGETGSVDLGPMITRSRQLETMLQAYAPAQQVFDAPTALAVSILEDRIQLIDEALIESRAWGGDRALVRGLWNERVNALETLVGVQGVQIVQQREVWR